MQQTLTSFQERNNQQLNLWLEQLPYQEQPLIQAMKYGLLLGANAFAHFLFTSQVKCSAVNLKI